MKQHIPTSYITLALALTLLALLSSGLAASQPQQTPELIYNEAQAVYLGNLARRANGVPPLRWNNQLTQSARWFSWDSVENRPSPYCGHQDTQGNWPYQRAALFGYLGSAGAENAYCGYVTPQQAIYGWMQSEGHRGNLLDPNSREVGLGYYRRTSDGRGYVTQDFGVDPVYPPVIINDEAPNTTTNQVNLYIYNGINSGSFMSMGAASQMQVSNDPCFQNAAWEPYQAEKAWTLAAGQGWRNVYVRLRDALLRTVTVSDNIYSGSSVPLAELGESQMATTQSQVILENLSSAGRPLMQFSPSWRVDDSYANFTRQWGNGERVSDADAWGGTAFRMTPGDGESAAWVWTTDFIKNTPFVAYVRMKVSNNSLAQDVARFSVTGGSTITLKGTDFKQANQYQEFPIAFTFQASETFLIFRFRRIGDVNVELYVDGLTIFTSPQAAASSVIFTFPGGNYRGQGIWVRYTDGSNNFSDIYDAAFRPPGLNVTPSSLAFLALKNGSQPGMQALNVQQIGCTTINWQVSENSAWLIAQGSGSAIQVWANQSGLKTGTYTTELTITSPEISPIVIPVQLKVVDQLYFSNLPLINR